MTLRKRWLSAALTVQVLFAAVLTWQMNGAQNAHGNSLFFPDGLAALTRMTIEDGDTKVELTRAESGWVIASSGLPVSDSKLERVLAELGDLSGAVPVVTRQNSHARFSVAEDDYYRKVALFSDDDQLGTLYVGSTPAMRQAHVRLQGDNNVYAASLNRFEFSLSENGWLDKTLLQAKSAERIQAQDWVAKKTDDGWTLEASELTENQADKAKLISDWAQTLETLNVIGKAEGIEESALSLVAEFTVQANDAYLYRFYEQGNDKFVMRDDWDVYFKLTAGEFSALAKLDLSDTAIADSNETSLNSTPDSGDS